MAIKTNDAVWFAGATVIGVIPSQVINADDFSSDITAVNYGSAQSLDTDFADVELHVTAGGGQGNINLYRRLNSGPSPTPNHKYEFIGAFQMHLAAAVTITLSGVATAPLMDQDFHLENKTGAVMTCSMDITPRAIGPKV